VRFTKSDQYLVQLLLLLRSFFAFHLSTAGVNRRRGLVCYSGIKLCFSVRSMFALIRAQWRHVPFVQDAKGASEFY
jgi:hypothetical protein